MANKHLSRYPIFIDMDTWYYEEPSGIEIIHIEPHETEDRKVTHTIVLWEQLRKSIARKNRK